MNNINPPSKCTHTHTHPHIPARTHTLIHTCDQMPFYLFSECNLRLLHPSISLSLWRLLFLCSAFLSLCVTLLLHKETRSGLIIFGRFIHFAFELRCSVYSCTHIQSHTDVITDVKNTLHLWYISSLIGFPPKNTVQWNMMIQLSYSHYYVWIDLNYYHEKRK